MKHQKSLSKNLHTRKIKNNAITKIVIIKKPFEQIPIHKLKKFIFFGKDSKVPLTPQIFNTIIGNLTQTIT